MNIIIIILVLIPVLYWGLKVGVKQIMDSLNNKIVYTRQKSDEFERLEKEYLDKKLTFKNNKDKILLQINNLKDKINLKQKDIDILKVKRNEKEGLNKSEGTKLSKFEKEVIELKKKIDNIKTKFNKDNSILSKEISELKKNMNDKVKVSLDDFNLMEKYLLSSKIKRLLKEAQKKGMQDFGAVEVFYKTGSKLFFKKFNKIMNVDGSVRFYNPLNVQKSWTGLPTIYYDEDDYEPKNVNNFIAPMGAKELATVMFDQNLPKEENKISGRNWMIRAAIFVVIIWVVWTIFSGDGSSANNAAPVVKEVVNQTLQNTSSVVIK